MPAGPSLRFVTVKKSIATLPGSSLRRAEGDAMMHVAQRVDSIRCQSRQTDSQQNGARHMWLRKRVKSNRDEAPGTHLGLEGAETLQGPHASVNLISGFSSRS
ncbi:uncharacterized protein SPSK_10103 [Sporothrix schenckii 1099-18]|uniref:Uncharacterized protein n=1 Tax=Sporothrix schenckii 1099-18 TaxID=1397361 RepID=A0A0F2MCV3_SPOSC|nr:uncharacterized protein SPSK_10103 [Sporothrix schenckii 1099-18]KJR85976.1 hypothetical protein SPSK_10103 [Sporothrix schenckii 1099-18]